MIVLWERSGTQRIRNSRRHEVSEGFRLSAEKQNVLNYALHICGALKVVQGQTEGRGSGGGRWGG